MRTLALSATSSRRAYKTLHTTDTLLTPWCCWILKLLVRALSANSGQSGIITLSFLSAPIKQFHPLFAAVLETLTVHELVTVSIQAHHHLRYAVFSRDLTLLVPLFH